MTVITYDPMGNPTPAARRYPFTPIVKLGGGWAPAGCARTSLVVLPGETWLQALARRVEPPSEAG